MSSTDDVLANNEGYAASFDKADLPLPPGRKLAVVACMDARLNVYGALGLQEGVQLRGEPRCGAPPSLRRQLDQAAGHPLDAGLADQRHGRVEEPVDVVERHRAQRPARPRKAAIPSGPFASSFLSTFVSELSGTPHAGKIDFLNDDATTPPRIPPAAGILSQRGKLVLDVRQRPHKHMIRHSAG